MVMKVYVVREDADDNYFTDWLGIYSTYEKAQAYIDYLRSFFDSDYSFELSHSHIEVVEYEVDELY